MMTPGTFTHKIHCTIIFIFMIADMAIRFITFNFIFVFCEKNGNKKKAKKKFVRNEWEKTLQFKFLGHFLTKNPFKKLHGIFLNSLIQIIMKELPE